MYEAIRFLLFRIVSIRHALTFMGGCGGDKLSDMLKLRPRRPVCFDRGLFLRTCAMSGCARVSYSSTNVMIERNPSH